MKRRIVELDLTARRDLSNIYDWIAEHSGRRTAAGYVRRIARHLAGFDLASERGTQRDDIGQGVRTVGFERRVTIIFRVTKTRVEVLRILYGGRDLEAALERVRPQR